jgi:endonuclease/exonuclease/phosphatase family metal-dependent hydrolase
MPATQPLRILTLNTWKNDGDYPARLAAMIEGLRALAPDLVLLQEVFRVSEAGAEADTARTLGDALGLAMVYAPARAKARPWQGRSVPSESGLALLVRGEILAHHPLQLPSTPEGGERIALLARAVVRGRTVTAACVHLSHLRGDDDGRRAQLDRVLADPTWLAQADLRVLGGDFNATRESAACRHLASHPTLNLTEAFAALACPPPTHPLPQVPGRGRAIDLLYSLSPRQLETAPAPQRAGIGLDSPSGNFWPSDHAAVWADY